PVAELSLQDDGAQATLTCRGAADSGFTGQALRLRRPGQVTLTRDTDRPQAWWCYGAPAREGNALRWEDGTVLEVTQGTVDALEPAGYHDEKVVGMGLLKLKDPTPMTYALVTARPHGGQLTIEVRRGGG
ncbi:MAG: hypothetical protein HYU66_08600, partial [Armatimonadetes bacterium]|nr:hypothetical protein [Armatimonadota bacterium]